MILEAQIESSPPPIDIQWTKDRNIIKPDGRKFFEVKSDAYNPKLRVENVDFTDSGTYCIAVTNALGSDKDQKTIKVRGMLYAVKGFFPLNLNLSLSINVITRAFMFQAHLMFFLFILQ